MLADVAAGAVSVEERSSACAALRTKRGGAHVDHHRGIRQGVPEVIFGEGKTADQIVTIARSMRKAGTGVLITRLSDEKMRTLRKRLRGSEAHPGARCLVVRDDAPKIAGKGTVLVVTAGTPDIRCGRGAVTAISRNRVDVSSTSGSRDPPLRCSRPAAGRAVIVVGGGWKGAPRRWWGG